jgi:putative oxygen-independent coproporphyrinogen III oxidase
MPRLPPLSVYVHMPWCLAKCPYCDFNSHVAPTQLPQAQYVDCLLGDLAHDSPHVQGRTVQSVFFGGGTPSLFAPESIGKLLFGLRAALPVSADMEVTMEANPGALEHGEFTRYRAAGVTRVSLGVQSFNDAHLRRLGRIHDSGQAAAAARAAHAAGFDNFNLDLMYGLPEQSVQQSLADLDCALALRPTHISHYQLTLEPGTVFYHRPPALPDDDRVWEMQLASQAKLAAAGFGHYEISAYALPGSECRHNLNYWQFGDYLGLGAGAHGKWTTPAGDIVRTERVKQPREYLAAGAAQRIARQYTVDPKDRPFEFMLNALRLSDGFDAETFQARTGLRVEAIAGELALAERKGLLQNAQGRWAASELGARFLNDLQAIFLT